MTMNFIINLLNKMVVKLDVWFILGLVSVDQDQWKGKMEVQTKGKNILSHLIYRLSFNFFCYKKSSPN